MLNPLRTLEWLFPALWAIKLPIAPLLAAAAVTSIASTALGIAGSKSATKKAEDAAQHDKQLAKRASEIQVEGILASKTEAEAQAAQKMSDLARASAIERGRILAGAGEAGVAGGSVSTQLLASYAREADSRGRELYNLSAYKRQANREVAAAQAGLQVNLGQYKVTEGPSTASLALSGITQLLSIFAPTK